jgi:hypothetical protein
MKMTKRDPTDPGGEYAGHSPFCAEEGYGVSITGESRKKNITDLVVDDLRERSRKGFEKYGKALLPHDGRDSLQDFYEELLDAAQYVKKFMEERDE